jgi:hypothetical protein
MEKKSPYLIRAEHMGYAQCTLKSPLNLKEIKAEMEKNSMVNRRM